ncbi:anaerobic ribonucleoside-triphosphate reductase-activating protein [Rhodobacteraceae bacterium RKSG542]|uniref:anaerobic ribonucleoside-triphosphate reductase-activating protein n=1 Tax=Pseudovibrio flavus TaxID=2529854 RepID=UPI0012BC0613|nr:anaerobic ribonucleoside-triphosphate reductase-activating protein [Pseudovibrio flavus]MTI16206.1 anaerobic ribonucleoside-triphosphate reductase-activating protein [Pseudovibrio flavus]
MNYHRYIPIDVVNGPGTRATLFVSGCEHKCRGCYNATTWKPTSGHPFTQEMEDQIIADLCDTKIRRRGLSLSGGDPLFPSNIEAVGRLVRRAKAEAPTKDIWLWSGYTLEEMSSQQLDVLAYVDVLVDGKFVQELHDAKLVWRGSSNQRILELKDIFARMQQAA